MNIYSISGYNEVGKNMSVIETNEDAFILDCGLYMPAVVELEEKERPVKSWQLRKAGALPDDFFLDKINIRKKVKAIVATHAHLDHIGAIPYLASRYDAKIIATPFTCEVLETLLKEENIKLKNEIKTIQPNSSYFVDETKIELINVTHSTLQTALVALHTKEGIILYANDFKFDNSPIVGKRPSYSRLKELASKGIIALIVDALYAAEERKTPSEKIARGLLEDVLLTTTARGCIVVTTFSSHIARLKSIVDFGKQLGREIIFLGRSLRKYVNAAAKLKLISFHKDIKLYSYRREIQHILKKVQKDRTRYLLVVTGHQGEPGSILDRMSRGTFFLPQDHVVFSTTVIPVKINIENRMALEKRLKDRGTRIFTDIHTSGHCMREDLRDFINMLQPQHIIPAHGDLPKLTALAELATELGYKLGKNCHIMKNLQKLKL